MVTTMAQQDGTGEKFTANEFSAGVTFSRKIVESFSFGAPLNWYHQRFGTLLQQRLHWI